MTAVVTLLALFTVSTVVTKIAAAWLMATGMSQRYARFQARSAFTGVGFTTTEAESVVNHPVRRRVITRLMLLGNLGVGAVVAGLIVSYDGADGGATLQRTALLVVGGLAVLAFSKSSVIDRALVAATRRLLRLGHGSAASDRATLLHLGGDHDIVELAVHEDDWLCGRELGDLRLRDEGVIVLGRERHGLFEADLARDDRIAGGDLLVLFGPRPAIEDLDDRRRGIGGELAHVDRVTERRGRAPGPDAPDAADTRGTDHDTHDRDEPSDRSEQG